MSVDRLAQLREFGARLAGPLPAQPAVAQHFYLIDLFRGFAAVAVLFCHYQHFYMPFAGAEAAYASSAEQPLYGLFGPLYDYGRRAVQFFWAISGFVMASVYAHSTIGMADFARNRLARLYPLHLLTLLLVAALQAVSMRLTGHFQVVEENDWFHFMLNLFFASGWGFEENTSFNAPIWSVSIEIAIYAAFWATLPFLFKRGALYPALLTAVFAVLTQISLGAFWTCGLFFFGGATMYALYRLADGARMAGAVGAALCAGASGLIALGVNMQIPLAVAFAGVILLLAALENTVGGRFAAKQHWLGDSTYGTYLWHLPMQIVVLMLFATNVWSRDMLASPLFLVAYIAAAIGAGWLSYRYFERPTRTWLRTARWPRIKLARAAS